MLTSGSERTNRHQGRQGGSGIYRDAARLCSAVLRTEGAVAGVSDLPDQCREACVLKGGPERVCRRPGHSRGGSIRSVSFLGAVAAPQERARSRPLAAAHVDGRGGRLFWIRPTCQGSLPKARGPIRGTHQLGNPGSGRSGLRLLQTLAALRTPNRGRFADNFAKATIEV